MEIEPHQLHSGVFNSSMGLIEVLPQPALRPFPVDQVDQPAVLVGFVDVVVVFLHHVAV